jgi:oligopeptide transport system substrate-binding protein
VQRVHIALLGDRETQELMDMYEADRLDALRLAPFRLTEQQSARQRHAGEYVVLPGVGVYGVVFDPSWPPFDDVRVRQAIAMATDRETLANVTLGGLHAPATGGFVPPGMPAHAADIGLPYDPERARRLLALAGYPGGLGFPPVELVTWHTRRAWAEHVAQQVWDNLGVKIVVNSTEWAEYLDRIHSGRQIGMQLAGEWADFPDPDSFLRVGSAVSREGRWTNVLYDQLVEEARRTMDLEKRMRLYRKADRILMEEAVIMPLTYSTEHLLVKPWLRDFPPMMREVACWKDVIIEPH